MTEYTTSPEYYQEYMTARERTAYWVQSHSSDLDGFYSPSVPPSEMEGFIPSSPPSDAGSSHSQPPKMVLRYSDGRPDVPVPYNRIRGHSHKRFPSTQGSHGPPHPSGYERSHITDSGHSFRPPSPIAIHPPSHNSSRHGRVGSSSQHAAILGPTSGSPEEIRVLPSRAPPHQHSNTQVSHRQGSHHSRSKSLPRNVTDPGQIGYEAAMGMVPVTSPQSRPMAYPPPSSHHSHGVPQANFVPQQAGPGPWNAVQTSSGSGSHGSRGHPGRKGPPAIVYAPSHHGHLPQYAPPPIYYHQPQRGPDGMIYSHSAPVPLEGGAYPPPTGTDYHGERGRRERTRSLEPGLVHRTQRSDDGEVSDPESAGSGSTYYVLPAAGQKVHVITPSPDQSVHTATSTTKSPGSPRRPFFQRFFGFAKFGSSGAGPTRGPRRKLERRHSLDTSARRGAVPVDPSHQ